MLTSGLVFSQLIAIVLAMQGGKPDSQESAMGICELMADLPAYKNRVVTVIGEYSSDPERSLLGAPVCKKPFTTFGYEWPTAVQLRLVGGPDVPARVPFEPDAAAVESFHRAVRALHSLTVEGCIVVTGMVQMRDDYSPTFTMRDGKRRALGFGHMNALPAQLVIKTVRVISLQSNKGPTVCTCCK